MCCREEDEKWSGVTCGKAYGEPGTYGHQDMFYWKYQTSLFAMTNWQHGYFKELYRVTQHFSCTVPLIWRIVYTFQFFVFILLANDVLVKS